MHQPSAAIQLLPRPGRLRRANHARVPYNLEFEAEISNALCAVNLAGMAIDDPGMRNEAVYAVEQARLALERLSELYQG